ncbi:MAG: CheF family chemotaxis protein [Haloferacaceae archaeon]
MSESVIADFRADVWSSTTGADAERSRVVLSRKRIVIVAEGSPEVTIPVSAVFDVAPDQAPAHLETDVERLVSIGFLLDGTRHTATIGAEADTAWKAIECLFTVRLSDTEVIVVHPSRVGGAARNTPPHPATLSVSATDLTLTGADTTLSLAAADLLGFEHVTAEEGTATHPTIRLRHESGTATVHTDVTFESKVAANVFGRYLRVHSDATPSAPGSISVLFVDDEPGLVETMAEYVTRDRPDADVKLARSALEGLDQLSENPDIDCVVSDYRMPRMNGIEFLRAVREVRPNLPFIMFTGMGNEAVAEEALAAGVTDYIRKDVGAGRYDELADRIGKAVTQQRPHV